MTQDKIARAPEVQTEELAPTRAAHAARAEIEAAMVVAQRAPRDEELAIARISKACDRPRFAALAAYSYQRGGKEIAGPSVYLGRELAKAFGNIRIGSRITRDDEEKRSIEVFAWDLERNLYVSAEDTFEKKIQRRRQGATVWVVPDERDLRELTSRRRALLERNCILELLPRDIIDQALEMATETLEREAGKDPRKQRAQLVAAFEKLQVTAAQLTAFLGHPVDQATPSEIVRLRRVHASIADGASFSDYLAEKQAKAPDAPQAPAEGALDVKDLEPTPEAELQAEARREEYSAYLEGMKTKDELLKEAETIGAEIRKSWKLSKMREVLLAHALEAYELESQAGPVDVAAAAGEALEKVAESAGAELELPEQPVEQDPELVGRILRAASDAGVADADVRTHVTERYGVLLTALPPQHELEVLAWIRDQGAAS